MSSPGPKSAERTSPSLGGLRDGLRHSADDTSYEEAPSEIPTGISDQMKNTLVDESGNLDWDLLARLTAATELHANRAQEGSETSARAPEAVLEGDRERMFKEIASRVGADENPEVWQEILERGAESGFPGFTDRLECVRFFDRYELVILDLAVILSERAGYRSIAALIADNGCASLLEVPGGYQKWMAWFALEGLAVARVKEATNNIGRPSEQG